MISIKIQFKKEGVNHVMERVIEGPFLNEENERVWFDCFLSKCKEMVSSDMEMNAEYLTSKQNVEAQIHYEQRREEIKARNKVRNTLRVERIDFVPDTSVLDLDMGYEQVLIDQVSWTPDSLENFLFLLRHLERWQKKSVPALIAKGKFEAAEALRRTLRKTLPMFANRDDIYDWIVRYNRRINKMIKDCQ